MDDFTSESGSSFEDIVESAIADAATPSLFPEVTSGPTGSDPTTTSGLLTPDLPTFGAETPDDFILGTPRVGENSNFISAGGGNDKVAGSESVDIVSGGAGDDYLTGGKGDDELSGGEGNDVLDGGEGNDLFVLSGGQDFALGGSGADGFVLSAQGVSDVALAPRILDFDPTEGDTLLLPDGIKPEDVFYEIDEAGNTILRLANGRILLVLEGVDLSELFDLDGDGGPVRPGQEELDDRPSGAKDLGILSGERLEAGELTSRDTYDLFKFRVETSTLLDSLLTPANGAEVELSLYQDKNRDGVLTADEEIANTEDDQGGLDTIENYLLKPGEYYLAADLTDQRARNSEQPFSSSYKLNLAGTPATESRDRAGNNFANAIDLGRFKNQQINEFLSPNDLADIYRIQVEEGDYFEVNLSGELSEKVSLILVKDSNGTGSVEEEEVVEGGLDSLTVTGLEAGSYYLVLIADDDAKGSYQLDLEMGGGSPVDNELFTPIFPNQPEIGKVSRESRVDPLNENRRFEEYAISELSEGDRFSLLISSSDGIPNVELIDSFSQEVRSKASPVPGVSAARIDFAIPDRRNYVIRVYSAVNTEFNYRLDLTDVSRLGSSEIPVARSSGDLLASASADPEVFSITRHSRSASFLLDSVDPSGKKPDPQFLYTNPGTKKVVAYTLDYREIDDTKVGLVGSQSSDLSRARISDIQQGTLGDCAFIAAVAALFGRVNPNPGQGQQGRSSVVKKPNEASSEALQSIFKRSSPEAYSFGFYPDGKQSKQPEFVEVDTAILTKQKDFSFPSKNYANFSDGTKVKLSGAGVLEIVDKNGNISTVGRLKNREEYFKALQKIDLTTVQGLQNSANNTNTSQKFPFAAGFPKTLGSDGRPIDRTTTGTSWVNAIERAYAVWRAKSFGGSDGYSIIGQGDWMNNTLGRLTGRKTVTQEEWTNKDLFKEIDQAFSRGDFVGAIAPAESSNKNPALVGGHAYAVTDVYNTGTEAEPQYRIVVFNPHGRDGTTEPDPSNVGGHPKAKPTLFNDESSPLNDGFIDLSFSEFNNYFGSVTWTQKETPEPITPTPNPLPSPTPNPPSSPTPTPNPLPSPTPIPSQPPTPIVPPPSTLQPQPNGGIAPATPAEFFTLTPQDDRFIMPTVGTGALGKVRALAGNDNLEGSAGTDEIFGNEGRDIAYGRGGDDRLWGGKGNDRLYGNDGNDFLKGEQGNDLLVGDKGNDTLGGGFGNDVLVGGEGTDTLTGGRGADVFALLSPFAVQDVNTADRISDFVGAEGDRIALTDGLTGDSIVLEAAGTATVIRLKGNNAILGVVENAAPADLRDRFTTYGAALNEPTAVRNFNSATVNKGSILAANTAPNNPGIKTTTRLPTDTDP